MHISKKIKIPAAVCLVLAVSVVIWDFVPVRQQAPLAPYLKGGWGMSIQEIKMIYELAPEPESTENTLVYRQAIAGRPATITYFFDKQGLVWKKVRLSGVCCVLDVRDISLADSQRLAENLTAAFSDMDGFQYNYYGTVYDYRRYTEDPSDGFRWSFWGWARSKNTDIAIMSFVSSSRYELVLFFTYSPIFLKFEDRETWRITKMLNSTLNKYMNDDDNPPFDYLKWENVYPGRSSALDEQMSED